MFFRREKPVVLTFDDRLSNLRRDGFAVAAKGAGKAAVMRQACAAVVREGEGGRITLEPVGVVLGNEIGELVDGGYQKFFQTPSGHRSAARAEQLREVHAFVEDLRESLGLTSLYNESLGSVNEKHVYDRVEGRDAGSQRPWRD